MITGYPILDNLTGGFSEGNLITLVGGPLAGKSMFSLNILRNQMEFEVAPNTAFMTAELSAEDAETAMHKLAAGEGEAKRMKEQILFVDLLKYCPDFESLRQKIIDLVRKDNVKAIVIDSFHFLPFIDNYPYDKLPNISRKLKFLARELGIVIIITTRPNYQPSERSGLAGKRPFLSDLEYVGDLNYFSDVVLGMMRPEMLSVNVDMEGNSLKDIIQVELLKSRKSFMELISYKIMPDNGLIEEKELLDKHNWIW
ncbi:MAG: hypothetical protein IJR69_11575 [Bacteroidaceae bacterium]|nr:hypothetical protein [Bacteroidaceae bacterium]